MRIFNQNVSKERHVGLGALFVFFQVVSCVKGAYRANIGNWVASIHHNSSDKQVNIIGYIGIRMKNLVYHAKRIKTGLRLSCDVKLVVFGGGIEFVVNLPRYGQFSFFFFGVDWCLNEDGDFETGHFVLRVFVFGESPFVFIDGGVMIEALFSAIRVGVETDGEVETEVHGLLSFLFFFVGLGANTKEARGVLPWQSFCVLAMMMVWE